jgi:GTP-binding protein
VNFYNVNNAMYLVDLPGYGYANANIEIKAQWGKMIEKYLHTSKQLQAVFLLIDIRHDPSENDKLMYGWMVEQGFAPIIIATKLDKIKRGAVDKHVRAIEVGLDVEPGTIIIPFSAETKQGRDEIWALVDDLVLPEDGEETLQQVEEDASEGKAELSQEPKKERKPRWKAEGKATAKKTLKLQEKKAAKKAKPGKKRK